MGKVKRGRQKYHTTAVKVNKGDNEQTTQPLIIDSGKVEAIFPSEGLFSGVDIPNFSLKQKLNDPDFDARSSITSKSLRGTNMKKKDKQKLRHDMWMKKIDTISHVRKKEKDRKKRQKTAVVGDMQPLGDTLPSLQLLLRDHKTHKQSNESDLQTEKKFKSIKKEKRRKKDMLEDISIFQQVLQHPAFKKNPGETVTEHLQNKLEMESE